MSLIRSAALDVIKSLVPLDLPAKDIINVLDNLQLTYRNIDMYADIRTAFGRVKYESQVTALSSNQVVPDAWMSTEKLGAPYEYRVQFKVDYYNPSTGEYMQSWRYMFSDDLKKIGDYTDDFPDYASETASTPEWEITGVNVVGMAHNSWE